MKICNKCKKESDNFSPLKSGKDGLSSWCRDCKREHGTRARRESGIKPKRYRRFENGLLECLDCNKFLDTKSFSDSKRGSFGKSSYCKKCASKRKSKDKEGQNRRAKQYRAKGTYRPAHRLRQFNRKATIKATSDGTVTKEFTLQLLDTEHCTYCKKFTDKTNRTLDHVVPLNKGGIHSATNLVMACVSCNSTKKDLDLKEFLENYV